MQESQNPKTRKVCVGLEQRRASKRGLTRRFSQDLCQRTKGPMDSFKGFLQEPEEPFWLKRRSIQHRMPVLIKGVQGARV
jgi:hypothetical protein